MGERDDAEAAGRPARPPRALPPGTRVEVRSAYDGSWTGGFEVAAVERGAYRLVRSAERTQLPRLFPRDDVRRERRRDTWWW